MSPQVVSLDWVAYSVTLAWSYEERSIGHAILHAPPGYVIVECKHGTPQYKRRYYLQTKEGDKIATLLLEPHSAIIDKRDMYVEIANPVLYQDGGPQRVHDLIAQVHEHSFRSLSRLDVACDFQPDQHQQEVIAGLEDMRYYVQGKREGAQFHDYHLPAAGGVISKRARCLSWGSKQSAMKWKLYNKTLELYQPDSRGNYWCTKPYIPETWRRHGMGHTNVWRLEASLTGASSFSWRDEKVGWPLVDSGDWEAWYWDMVKTRYTIRANQGHACRKNDAIVPFLDIPAQDTARLRERVGDGDQAHVDHAATLRACIRELERPEVAYSPQWRDLWLRTTAEVLDRGNLHGYFERVTGTTFDEWACTLGDPLLTTNN